MHFHVAVPYPRELSPAGAHYRWAWSWLPGSRLICHIPAPSCCWAQQIGSVVKWFACVCVCVFPCVSWEWGLLRCSWGWWGGGGLSGTSCSGEHRRVFSYGPCLLRSCFLTIILVEGEGWQWVTSHVLRAFPCGICLVSNTVTLIHAFLFKALYCTVKQKWGPGTIFIHLQDAWDGPVAMERGKRQQKQRFMT